MAQEEQSPFGEVIYSYTRAQAIEDGYLVDVTETASESGIKFPVAVTRTVWDEYIVPDKISRKHGQSESGRLWDILSLFRFAAKRHQGSSEILYFHVYFIMKEKQKRLIPLKAHIDPGDNSEPVITIMKPGED